MVLIFFILSFAPNPAPMNCPVCKASELEDGVASCSECGSNLSTFNQINEIKSRFSMMKKVSITVGVVLFAAVATLSFMQMNPGSTTDSGSDTTDSDGSIESTDTKDLQDQIEDRDLQITDLKREIDELLATMGSANEDIDITDEEGSYTIHIVEKGESLWSISEKYHGHGHQHAELADYNKLENPRVLRAGDTIIVRHD